MGIKHCAREDESSKPPMYSIFLKDVHSKMIVPSFLECNEDGSATISMAEGLVPAFNEALQGGEACFNPAAAAPGVAPEFVDRTMRALQAYEGKCPEEDRSCGKQIADLLVQDVSNAVSLFKNKKKAKDETTKMGCLSNVVASLKESLISTLKLFVWDIPKKVWEIGKSTWNYLFDRENKSSTAMLLSSVMAEDMAQALAKWDLAKFYSLLRKNFFKFLGNIREFYTELLGCTEWKGTPFESECLKKTNWSCPTCESTTNFFCGLAGQLGTGFALGGLLGTAKSVIQMSQIKKAISLNPKKYGVSTDAIKEMGSKVGVNKAITDAKVNAQTMRYKASLYTRPVTDVLTSVGEEIKLLSGIGKNFQKFVSANPVTMPYHLAFQYSKKAGFKRTGEYLVRKSSQNSSLALGRRFALRLSSLSDNFTTYAKDFYKIKGTKFNQGIYDDIMTRYLDDVAEETRKMGIKVEKLPDGHGLKLEKGGEIFEYRPDFRQQMDIAERFTADEFRKQLAATDPILFDSKTMINAPAMPNFLRDIHQKASVAKDVITLKTDGLDGLIYLGHFGSQQNGVPRIQDCKEYLHDAEYLEMQDITDAAQR